MSTTTLTNEWDTLDPEGILEARGPTAGMAGLIALYRKKGHQIIDAAQGAEQALEREAASDNDRASYNILSDGIALETGEYLNGAGGEPLSKEQSAEYLRTTYRLPANAQNTFLGQFQGRAGVNFEMNAIRRDRLLSIAENNIEFRLPQLLMPQDHWKTLSDNALDASLSPAFYDSRNPDPADAILTQLDTMDHRYVGGILLNYISNPLSTPITTEQFGRVINGVSNYNRANGVNIHLLIDSPYTFASEVLEDNQGSYLNSGMQNMLNDVDNIDYAVVLSLSKLFSLAKCGATIMMVNQERAKDVGVKLSNQGLGLARFNGFTDNVGCLLADHPDIVTQRTKEVSLKYDGTGKMLDQAFGPQMIPGVNGMLRMQEIPVRDVIGKRVTCSDGVERVTRNGNHVVTYLLDTHNIGLVNTGVQNGRLGIRYAARNDLDVAKQLVERSKSGFDALVNAPSINLS